MKKLLFILFLALILTSCSEGKGLTNEDFSSDSFKGITVSAKKVTAKGLVLACKQDGTEPSGDLITDDGFFLERKTESGWEGVRTKHDPIWTMTGIGIPLSKTTEISINWEYYYGELPAGTYRIGKKFLDQKGPGDYTEETLWAAFEIY